MFQSIYATSTTSIQKSLGKDLGWIIDSVIDQIICISKYNTIAGSSYTNLSKDLDHPRKGFINIQNTDDNECFKWSLVRYVNPANHYPVRITKADKYLAKRLDFKDIKLPVEIRYIHKFEKKISSELVFLTMKIKKNIHLCTKNFFEEKHVDLFSIGKREKTL